MTVEKSRLTRGIGQEQFVITSKGIRGLTRRKPPLFENFNSTMKYRFRVLVNQFRWLLEDTTSEGTWRFRLEKDGCWERLCCSYVGEVRRASMQFYQNGREGMLGSERFPVEFQLEPSGRFYLTAELHNSFAFTRKQSGTWVSSVGSQCGDLWKYWSFRQSDVFLVCDGLGHGEAATRASLKAADVLEETGDRPVVTLVEQLHEGLQSTRGAVVFVGRIPRNKNRLEYCSVGNIDGQLLGNKKNKSLISLNGTVGHTTLPELRSYTKSLDGVEKLVLHTDGIQSPDSDYYDETFRRSGPEMNALRLLSSHRRETDDALASVVEL